MERPPLRATAPPTRSARWDVPSQRALLRHELCELSFYRRLMSASSDDKALLAQLEREYDRFVADDGEAGDPHAVFALRFPPMASRHRSLLSRLAERYHLQGVSYGEHPQRFTAVYKHPRSVARPILRLADLYHAASYYTPPPPPPPSEYKRRRYDGHDKAEGVELEAEEVLPSFDYSRWALEPEAAPAPPDGEPAAPSGFECEIGECHEHILQLWQLKPQPPFDTSARAPFEEEEEAAEEEAEEAEAEVKANAASGAPTGARAPTLGRYFSQLVPEALACRPLPEGFLAVFASASAASAFMQARAADATEGAAAAAAPPTAADAGPGPSSAADTGAAPRPAAPLAAPSSDEGVRLLLGSTSCVARPLSALQRRPRRPAGGAAAPRALQSALRGLGSQQRGGRGGGRGRV